ncbi:MAG: ester cyclase [Caldilineaceae bacterium]
MNNKPPYYRIYLLTVWQEQNRGPPERITWRFRLEDPRTGRQQGFADAVAFMTALQALTESQQGGDPMTTEANKAIVRRWVAAINTQDRAELDTLLSPTLAQAWQETILPWIYGTFAGHHVEIEEILAEGDQVAIWVATSGAHTGEFEGVSPTGRQWTNKGIFLLRLRDNRIAEASWLFNDLNLLKQVGATVTLAT